MNLACVCVDSAVAIGRYGVAVPRRPECGGCFENFVAALVQFFSRKPIDFGKVVVSRTGCRHHDVPGRAPTAEYVEAAQSSRQVVRAVEACRKGYAETDTICCAGHHCSQLRRIMLKAGQQTVFGVAVDVVHTLRYQYQVEFCSFRCLRVSLVERSVLEGILRVRMPPHSGTVHTRKDHVGAEDHLSCHRWSGFLGV